MKAPEQARRRSTRKYLHLVIMKSKLPIIAALVSFTIGLPLQAQNKIQNRMQILAIISVAQCFVNEGTITGERGNEVIDAYIQENPSLEAAYEWAVNSSNARVAVEGIVPYMGADCSEGNLTAEILENVLLPYLE